MKNELFESLVHALSKNKEFSRIPKEEVEDCVQDASLLLEKKALPEVKADKNKTFLWLFAAAILVHKNHSRRDKRNTSHDKKLEGGQDYDSKDAAETKSTDLDEIHHFFSILSDLDVQIMIMNHLEGYTLQEVAKKLGLPYDVVKRRHGRAMETLSAMGTRTPKNE